MKLIITVVAVVSMFTFFVMSAESNEKANVALADSLEFSKVIIAE